MVLAVVDDLLFSSKIRSVAGTTGQTVIFVRSGDAALRALGEHHPELILFDLDRDALDPIGTIRAIRAEPDGHRPRIVGFASHVRAERIRDARAAGCDQAMPRSGFVTALPALLAVSADGVP